MPAPTRSNAPGFGSRLLGTSHAPANSAATQTGTLSRKTELQSKYSSRGRRPAGRGRCRRRPCRPRRRSPCRAPRAGHVGDDRQGGGHDQRAADAHHRADRDELAGGLDQEDGEAGAAEEDEAALKGELAAEAVAERAQGEQQAGEHQQVAVDHPLQRRGRRVELLLQAREGDVEDRVVEPDDREAQGQDGERLPAASADGGIGHSWAPGRGIRAAGERRRRARPGRRSGRAAGWGRISRGSTWWSRSRCR